MFAHVFRYRMKCFLGDRVTLFWTMVFPILLSTLFLMAFSNFGKTTSFAGIKVAVVNNDAYQENRMFQETLAAAAEKQGDEEPLLSMELVSLGEAETLLDQGEVHGIILLDPDIKLVVNQSGFNQSIIKSFLDQYQQVSASYTSLFQMNPGLLASRDTLKDYSADYDFIVEKNPGKNKTDITVTYFYALLAMTTLYGSFWGIRAVNEVQADQSMKGARINLAPVHKMKMLLAAILAAWIIQFVELTILILYMSMVLKVSFGSQAGCILLTCLVGSLTGITLGTMVGGLIKKSDGIKTGILLGITMTLSGFAGLYFASFKYVVTKAVPVLAYINPANLITDALYALYYYDTYERFTLNIILLLAFAAVFCLLTYLSVRRDRYASIPSIQEGD
jgi:ABC-2 type transport system permease protein